MKTLILICYLITHIQAMPSIKVATVKMADLFDSDPEVIALQKKANAQHAKIKADNEKRLKEIRAKYARLEALTHKIGDPKTTKLERNKLIRERHRISQTEPTNPSQYHQTLKKMQQALNIEIIMTTRKAHFRIAKKTQKYAETNDIDLLLDKSLKGANKRLYLIYGARELDITKPLRAGKTSSEKKGVGLHKIKIATINLNSHLLPKKLNQRNLTEVVAMYAQKNNIHLVFDSSAESTAHSAIILFPAQPLDITELIAKRLMAHTR